MDAEQAARYWRYALEALEGSDLNGREKHALLDLALTWDQGFLAGDEITRISQASIRVRPASRADHPSEHRIAG